MGAVVALAPRAPAAPERPQLTLPMRIALGLLHAGPLYLTGSRADHGSVGRWRSRARPDAIVLDQTMTALERRGYATMRDYSAGEVRRWCAQLAPAGEAAYRAVGGLYAGAPRLAPDVELTLERLDDALARIGAELNGLGEAAGQVGPRIAAARAEIEAATADCARFTARIAELTRLAGGLTGHRDALRRHLVERRR
jgi:hypothetical protein